MKLPALRQAGGLAGGRNRVFEKVRNKDSQPLEDSIADMVLQTFDVCPVALGVNPKQPEELAQKGVALLD